MSRRPVSVALELAQLFITAFIWMLAGMFLVSRMYGPAAAYAALAGASSVIRMRGWTRRAPSTHRSHNAEITYPYSLPRWVRQPHSSAGGCYGCGLEPELMKPGEWVLCFWCNELRVTMERRMHVSLLAV